MDETRGLWRGKRIDEKKWTYGYLISPGVDGKVAYIGYLVATDDHGVTIASVDPQTLGECTGLRDKNNRLIFECDIVQTKHGRLCKIVWRSNSSVNCWDMIPLECKHHSPDEWDLWDSKNLLVVGNMYDDPELLKGAGNEND